MFQSSPQYWLNKYHEQILRAIKLSRQNCAEYGVIKPEYGRVLQIKGDINHTPIPESITNHAYFLFHTHPYNMCDPVRLNQELHKYIQSEFSGKFSKVDVLVAHQQDIISMIVGTFISENTVVLRGFNSSNLAHSRSEFIMLSDSFLEYYYTYLTAGISSDTLIEKKLKQVSDKIKVFQNKYMPILETIRI